MQQEPYRALVVDDEPPVRQLTMRALSRRGFRCEPAGDGEEAIKMTSTAHYDVVVTDLQMPNQHGHRLAVELLKQEQPPAIVVVTGLAEPKLARDLLARGVDDILFKPVDYDFLGTKVEMLVRRRRNQLGPQKSGPEAPPAGPNAPASEQDRPADTGGPATQSDIETKLVHLSKILPVSQAAFDVFNMTSSEKFETVEIAAAVARDASLSADILRLANSGFYNPSGAEISDLDAAVVRIGQKRIGDLALATTAMASLTTSVIPWLDVPLAWHRSIAAGVAADLLVGAQGKSGESGMFLSAIMHPLGRIALAMLYPHEYQTMVSACTYRGETLAVQEARAFAVNHGEVMTLLLKRWGIPRSVCEPLAYITHRYRALGTLRDPLRGKAEMLKVAILVGRLAARKWEPWDTVDLPPEPVLDRLGIKSLAELVEETNSDAEQIIQFTPQASRKEKRGEQPGENGKTGCELTYCNLSPEPFDFLAAILTSSGITLKPCDPESLDCCDSALINCIWTPPFRLASLVNPRTSTGRRVIVTDAENPEPFAAYGRVFQTPMAFGPLHSACYEIAGRLRGDSSKAAKTASVGEKDFV